MFEPDKEEKRSIKRISDSVDNYTDRLAILVNRYVREARQELESADNEAQALAILARLSPELLPPSILNQINKLDSLYGLQLDSIKNRFAISDDDEIITFGVLNSEKKRITSEIGTLLKSIASAYALSKLAAGFKKKAPGIGSQSILERNAFADKVKTGVDVSITELKDNFIDSKMRSINTGIVTYLYGYRSSMEIRKATSEQPNPIFAYVGPFDNKNRPFCRKILLMGKLWTVPEINLLDKDPEAQLVPVAVFCGGYNCRHIWLYSGK